MPAVTSESGSAPTLDEVARLAGVSRATASRAINGGRRVSPGAQAAVDAAVRTLGYTPNPAARSLVTRRTDSVALIVPEPDERLLSDPFFGRTVRSVSRVLSERDLQVVLLLARPGEDGQRLLRYLRNRYVDGAVVATHHRNDSLAERLAALGLPCAFVGRPWTGADRVAYVDTDNVAGGREATQLLVDRGCTRIGHVAGPPDTTASVDRLEGWRAAVAATGLVGEAASGLVEHGDFTEVGGEAATGVLLDRHPDLDGLVVASDLMAVGALRALAGRGLRVPDDVAVVGYDDLGLAARTSPPLTTVRNPVAEMAEHAARLLLEQVEGDGAGGPMRVILPPSLVRRHSA